MASACVTKIEPYTWRTSVSPPSPNLSPDLSPDFEFFRSDDPTVTMLPADELFSDGKLKPISTVRSAMSSSSLVSKSESPKPTRLAQSDPFFSPRAPTCSIRWKNILKLKKLNKPSPSTINNTPISPPNLKLNTIGPSRNLTRSFKPDSDTDSVSTSSRLSLSSSSSSSQDEPNPKPTTRPRGNTLVESPRLNSYGKVVFERSTSSPGSFNNGSRNNNNNNNNNNNKNGKNNMGIERSYSAHVVRVAPILNVVPVKFGFPLFSSKKENLGSGRVRRSRSGNRTDQQA